MITEEQFLEEFKRTCKAFVEIYKQDEDPEDPMRLFWTRNFDIDRVAEMPEEYRIMGSRACKGGEDCDKALFFKMFDVARDCEQELKAWFETAGYDEANIPASPDIDHARRKMKGEELEAWKELSKCPSAKTAYCIGQLVYIGSSNSRSGWAELYLLTGERLYRFHPYASGMWGKHITEQVWSVAEQMSKLTNWSLFRSNSKKVNRAVMRKIDAIVHECWRLRIHAKRG